MGITTAMAIFPDGDRPPPPELVLLGDPLLEAPAAVPDVRVEDVVVAGDGVLTCVTTTVDGG
jgi:hypothetical protein